MQAMSKIFVSLFLIGVLSLSMTVGQTPPPTENGERKAGERMTLKIKDVEYAFRWCPPGTFMMGSPKDEKGRDNYKPNLHRFPEGEVQHQVTLSHGFWMQETQTTQGMWTSVMGDNPLDVMKGNAAEILKGNADATLTEALNNPATQLLFDRFKGIKFPVVSVSSEYCLEYIKTLNDLGVAPAGFKFSLPTEAQWEYACRAGTTTAFHFGDTLKPNQANFMASGIFKLREVGSYPANAWGLHDMHGNVFEWCLDWYGEYPSGAVTDPIGTPSDTLKEIQYGSPEMGGVTVSGPFRVMRGGCFSADAEHCRSAFRYHCAPYSSCFYDGLRLVLIRDEDEKAKP